MRKLRQWRCTVLRLATFVIYPSNVATGGYKKGTGRVTRPPNSCVPPYSSPWRNSPSRPPTCVPARFPTANYQDAVSAPRSPSSRSVLTKPAVPTSGGFCAFVVNTPMWWCCQPYDPYVRRRASPISCPDSCAGSAGVPLSYATTPKPTSSSRKSCA